MANYRRIAAASFQFGDLRRPDCYKAERDMVLRFIERAGALGVDLLLFQEELGFFATAPSAWEERAFFAPGELQSDLPLLTHTPAELAEKITGPYVTAVREAARKHRVNVILPLLEQSGDRIYNSLLPITSAGTCLPPYRKRHPVQGELDTEISPGTDPAVCELSGIRVGFSICFDMNFDEVFREAKDAGAQLMLWASMWMGGGWLRARALQYGFPLVSATPDGVSFVDADGSVLVESYSLYPQTCGQNNLVYEDLNFDKAVFHCLADGKLNEIVQKYGKTVHIRNRPQECICILESLAGGPPLLQLEEEFGLTEYDAFLRQSQAALAEYRRREASCDR